MESTALNILQSVQLRLKNMQQQPQGKRSRLQPKVRSWLNIKVWEMNEQCHPEAFKGAAENKSASWRTHANLFPIMTVLRIVKKVFTHT